MTKLLLVDDEKGSRLAIEEYLSARGFEVRSADNGEDAVTVGLEMAPEVLVCDWLLPGAVNGLEVVRTLIEAFPRLNVLVVTGLPVEEVARDTKSMKVAAILSKPVGLAALERAVREAGAG